MSFKTIGIAFLALLVLVVAGFFWLHSNLDALVKSAIERQVSAMIHADVRVGAVEIRGTDGVGIVRDLKIGNPAGFKSSYAVSVAEIEISIDLATLHKDVVVIRNIVIKAPSVMYEKGDTLTNFEAIQRNITASLGPSENKRESSGKKLILERLTIHDAKAEASAAFMQGKTVAVELPDIALHDLGKAKGGISPGELGQEITQAMRQKLTAALSFENIAKSMGQTLDNFGNVVKGLFRK